MDDEDVFVSNGLGYFNVDLSVRKLFDRARGEGDVEAGVISF